MKKTTTLSILILFFAITAFAGPVDPEKALEIANSFWKSIPEQEQSELHLSPVGPSKSAGRDGVQKADAQYYLFAPEDKSGFVIVSGEDRLAPVVGYSTGACMGEMPPALAEWLDEYSCFVDDVRAGAVEPVRTTAGTGKAIEPMLKTSWNQSAPYNNYCPEVNGQKTPTGCTATAMAQIMKFHEWPVKATKNINWMSNITGKEEYVNLTSHSYKWSDMLDHYRNGYTQAQADAVAQLMVDAGKAIHSSYALAGTGSSEIYVSYALVDVFDYSPDVTVVRRSEYTEDEYIAIIRENLEARQPLLYSGMSQSYGSGHAFVCDGIDENNMLHIDWGWDGAYNGYFDMTYMSPSGVGIGGGSGRYNVGQTLVANIHPRGNDEPDADGVPNVYMMSVYDPDTKLGILEDSSTFTDSLARVNFMAGLLNWSHSSTDSICMNIGFEKDGKLISSSNIGDFEKMKFDDSFGYYISVDVSNVPGNDSYLEKGTYTLRLLYADKEGNLYQARGAANGLVLEVGDSHVKLKNALPEIEVSEVAFHVTPQQKGDRISFDAEFRSNNGRSATVLIVPQLNKVHSDGTVSSTLLSGSLALIQVYDDRDILATFNTNATIPDDGEFFISFKYNMKNEFMDLDLTLDNDNLLDIEGKCENFIIEPLPDGAVLMTESLSLDESYVAWGSSLKITATVKNIASSDDVYNGNIRLIAEDVNSGHRYTLLNRQIEALEKDKQETLSYNSPDYLPMLSSGRYVVYICELKDGVWSKIKQSAATCYVNITDNGSVAPYVDGVCEINGGNKVRQGVPFTAKLNLNCVNGDFEGFVRVLISKGFSSYIKSEYIPVSLKKGVATEVVIDCTCSEKTPLGQYRLNINYHDSNKTKLGVVSNNTVVYPDNGYFWVADVTAVDNPQAEEVAVIVENGCITVDGASAVKVMCLDGRTLYSGNAASVAVENGVYGVVVEGTDGNVVVKKVLVK